MVYKDILFSCWQNDSQFSSVGGGSNFGATSPEGHIFIWNSPNTTQCKIVAFQVKHSVLQNFI